MHLIPVIQEFSFTIRRAQDAIGKVAQRIATSLLVPLLFTVCAHAQVNTGSLSGQVTDPSGAAVKSATLTIFSEATGYSRTVASGADGSYSFTNLPIGHYSLAIMRSASIRKNSRSSST